MDERRIAPRHKAHLKAQIRSYLLFDEMGNAESEEEMVMVRGETLDISASGLAITIPVGSIDEKYLPGGGGTLQVVLELPTGTIGIEAQPVRYEKLASEDKYLIGAHIVEIDEHERELFVDFLREADMLDEDTAETRADEPAS